MITFSWNTTNLQNKAITFSKPTSHPCPKWYDLPSRCRAAIWPILCCSSYLVNAGLPAGEREGEAQRKPSTFNPHILQKVCYALDNMVKELGGKEKHINLTTNPIQWALAGSVKQSFKITSSPVPCMISKGMAKILLYICTDLLLPLLILTSRTLKFVPPRSRARNFPFSEGKERYFILVLLIAHLPVRMTYQW